MLCWKTPRARSIEVARMMQTRNVLLCPIFDSEMSFSREIGRIVRVQNELVRSLEEAFRWLFPTQHCLSLMHKNHFVSVHQMNCTRRCLTAF
jgi:hypothetical protein